MRHDLTQRFYADFPDLYSGNGSVILYGFECGDGWYDIIYNLSPQIAGIVSRYAKAPAAAAAGDKDQSSRSSNPNNADMELMTDQQTLDPRLFSAFQVKEKFGTLRFYMNRATKEINEVIAVAEARTETTCESCGGEGSLKEG